MVVKPILDEGRICWKEVFQAAPTEIQTQMLKKLGSILTSQGTSATLSGLVSSGIDVFEKAMLQSVTTVLRDLGYLVGPPFWYKIIYTFKQIIGGFVSPTEWVEGAWFWSTGSMFGFSNSIINWLWNYGDNLYFVVFEDDSTWGMFKAFSAAAHGDWSHFLIWPAIGWT